MSVLADFFTTGGAFEHEPVTHIVFKSSVNFTATTGTRDALFDETLVNEITGAVRTGSELSLNAGTYRAKGYAIATASNTLVSSVDITKSDDTVLITGYASADTLSTVEGQFVLTETTSVKLIVQQSNATGTVEVNDVGKDCIVNSLIITQVDAIKTSPIIHDNKLYPLPGNTIVTGDVYGLDCHYGSTTAITVDAGICMDSLNTSPISRSTTASVTLDNTTIADGSSTATNTVYSVFVVDGGGIKFDTSETGSNIATTKRWISFIKTNAAGEICSFEMSDGMIKFIKASEWIFLTGVSTAWVQGDSSSVVPSSRIDLISFAGADLSTSGSPAYCSYDGVTPSFKAGNPNAGFTDTTIATGYTGAEPKDLVPYDSGIYFKLAGLSGGQITINSVTMKR